MMKKLITLLFITTAIMTTTSCMSDDDLPIVSPIQVNTFCYGNQTTNFETINAFRSEPQASNGTGVLSAVTIIGEGITLNDMNELEGAGVVMQLNFYGDSFDGFQTGLYQISDLEEPANVALSYSLDFDATTQFNSTIALESGFIRVEPYFESFAITVNGTDTNGDEFHGIYLGGVNLLP